MALAPAILAAQTKPVTLLGYKSTVPATWASRAPSSAMRLAEFVAPTTDGGQAEIVVYFFGKGQGGSVASNTERWKAQFSNPDGSPVVEKITREGTGIFPITLAEYRGTYARGIGAGSSPEQAKAGQELLAAIVETPNGTMFAQMYGPIASVSAHREPFMNFIKNLTP
ncbi:MAG: hypothetical protein JWM95_3500 [Gemmatimonadetes bacterium]|nr:hypothetical protein [Gemmatimonadota bacterium]